MLYVCVCVRERERENKTERVERTEIIVEVVVVPTSKPETGSLIYC